MDGLHLAVRSEAGSMYNNQKFRRVGPSTWSGQEICEGIRIEPGFPNLARGCTNSLTQYTYCTPHWPKPYYG